MSALQKSQEAERIYLTLNNSAHLSSSTETNQSYTENSRDEQFDQLLVEAIDEALCSLGEPVKNSVYLHLDIDFGIPKEAIPKNISEFSRILHKIFGVGARRLEMRFVKNLNDKIHADVELDEYDGPMSKWLFVEFSFQEYIYKMRNSYQLQELKPDSSRP